MPTKSDTEKKTCKYCNSEKPETDFRPKRLKCKDCEREHGRNYRKSEIGKQKSKEWVENNQERMTELQANHYERNKPLIREKEKERRENDERYKFRHDTKRYVNWCFRSRESVKKTRTLKYLDCTIDHFINWLEFCYTKKMDHDNYAEIWQFDHVIPIATFENILTDDSEKTLCCSWFNISPVLVKDNLSKHAKINTKQIKKHVKKLKKFCKTEEIDAKDFKEYFDLCATYLDAGNP